MSGELYPGEFEAMEHNGRMDALEQEPCEDAINRQAVDTLVDELARAISDERCCTPRGRSTATIMQDILDLPPVNPQPRWIPVSERLPEKYGEYLITWTTSQSKRPFIGISEGEVTGEYDHEHNRFKIEWILEDYIKAYPNVEVIAWMPLPAPYESYESEDKG